MADQKSDRGSKTKLGSQENSLKRGPMYHKQNQEGWDHSNKYRTNKMETFPKTRTFPKRWDLSSFSEDTK